MSDLTQAEPSKRQRIVQWFASRLELIRIDDGYATDAGAALYLGTLPQFGDDDPAVALALIIGADDPRWQGEKVFLRLPLEIHVGARGTDLNAWIQVEQALADVKRAVEIDDRTCDGLVPRQIERGGTVTLERPAGTNWAGIRMTYVAPFAELWGHPER